MQFLICNYFAYMTEETVSVEDLIENRDAAYINYLESSVRPYQPMESDNTDAGEYHHQPSSGGVSSWMAGVSAGGGLLLGGLHGLQVAMLAQ